MSIFGEQLKTRHEKDGRAVEKHERLLGDAVSTHRLFYRRIRHLPDTDFKQVGLIAQYYQLDYPDETPQYRSLIELLDQVLRPVGAEKRYVTLRGTWWKDGGLPMLATMKDSGRVLALFPSALGGYYYIDPETGRRIRIRKNEGEQFDGEAYVIYRPLPESASTGRGFFLFLIGQIRPLDLFMFFLLSFLMTGSGMASTFAVNFLFSDVIASGKTGMLVSLLILLTAVAVSVYLFNAARLSVKMRIQNGIDVVVQNSVFSRVLNLPAAFFADQTAGGLAKRISSLSRMSNMICAILLLTADICMAFLTGLPILIIAPKLMPPVVLSLLAVIALIFITVLQEKNLAERQLKSAELNSGTVYDVISGVERIRISGSERRAYTKWLKTYTDKADADYAVVFPLFVRAQLMTTVKMLGILWACVITWKNGLSVGQFASFSSAYVIAMSTLDKLANQGKTVSRLRPVLKMSEPLLRAKPEILPDKKIVTRLNGRISVSHLTFRYSEDSPLILDDLSFDVSPGEYVAIVGNSGCGKTTLVKLLLGFAAPETGTIYYDGTDYEQLDKQSLRRCIGTVLQNGKLFAGDIFSNITITAPWLTADDAWAAAEKAGIAEEIRRMPMGMKTYISEGGGGISGGQKQRLMIARAIAPNPGIVILDEATSALDNITQKTVTDSLNTLNATRLVIAHRLSTIRACDRIIALDKGRIIESGTYDELIEKNGFFADLVSRQKLAME